MKTIKLLSLTLAVLLMFGSVAYADVINQPVANDENATITVTGTIAGATYGDSVGIYVLKPGKTAADITEITGDKFKEVLAGYVSALTDSEGNYSAVVGLDGLGEGNYTILAASTKLSKNEELVYYFASSDAKLAFIKEVKEVVDASGSIASHLKAKLNLTADEESDTAKLLGLGASDLILSVDEAGLATVFYAMVKEDPTILTPEYPSDFVADLGIAALIQSLNEGTGDITDERLALDKKFVATFSTLGSTTQSSFVATYMKNKGLKSLKDVNEVFCDSVILAALNTATGWKDYEKIIVNHGEDLGIDMDDYEDLKKPSDVTDDLKDSYSDIDVFVKDVNVAIEELLNGQKKGNSSSGGGGGGGVSVGGTLPSGNVSLDEFEPKKVTFYDVAEDHWASESILSLAQSGAISGRGDGSFAPDMDVTREEFVKMAVVALGITVDGSTDTSYADVNASAWYAPYVAAAEKAEIISGIGEGEFGVGRTITRQEAAAILYRIGTKRGKTFTPATLAFSDDDSIADWAKEAVYALKGAGIISGISAREFAPLANCSRAQSAKLIHGLAGKE